MWKKVLLGLVIVLVLGVSLSSTNSGVTPLQWAEHYQIGPPPSMITWNEIPFIKFIPSFGDRTIEALKDNLPISSEAQLRAIDGISGKKLNILLALYDLNSEPPPLPPTQAMAVGRVIHVVDGDTFYIEYITGGEGLPISIRTYLASTPEVHRRPPECYGSEAEEYAWQMLFGRTVWLVHYNRLDPYNKLLAFVYLDPERLSLFQAIMIAQGFAKADIRHPEETHFAAQMLQLQYNAQADGRGRWKACP